MKDFRVEQSHALHVVSVSNCRADSMLFCYLQPILIQTWNLNTSNETKQQERSRLTLNTPKPYGNCHVVFTMVVGFLSLRSLLWLRGATGWFCHSVVLKSYCHWYLAISHFLVCLLITKETIPCCYNLCFVAVLLFSKQLWSCKETKEKLPLGTVITVADTRPNACFRHLDESTHLRLSLFSNADHGVHACHLLYTVYSSCCLQEPL